MSSWTINNYKDDDYSQKPLMIKIMKPRLRNSDNKNPVWALSDPGLAAQPECERSAAMVRGTWGQYVAVCLRLQLTPHTQPTSTLLNIV